MEHEHDAEMKGWPPKREEFSWWLRIRGGGEKEEGGRNSEVGLKTTVVNMEWGPSRIHLEERKREARLELCSRSDLHL
jgi:hypothetical protein